MKKKILGIFVCTLLITTILPITAIAGDEENPEIEDKTGDCFRGLDIVSAWFSDDGENLSVSIKLRDMMQILIGVFHYTVTWRYNDTDYFVFFKGFTDVYEYYYGKKILWVPILNIYSWNSWGTNGSVNEESAIITINMPLDFMGNPQAGEKLTKTQAMTHLFYPQFRVPLDIAPRLNAYGKDYIIGSNE